MERQILDKEGIASTLQQLARAIIVDVSKAPAAEAVLVGIRRRGVPLAQRLSRAIVTAGGPPLPVGHLDITFYRDDLSHVGEQPVVGITELPFSVSDRKIYLVDDVLYTGRTIRAAIDALLEFGRPSAIRLVVLVDRGGRELPIQPDLQGLSVPSRPTDNVVVKVEEIDGVDEVVMEAAEERHA